MITSEEKEAVGTRKRGNKKYKQLCIKEISYRIQRKTQGIYIIFYTKYKWRISFPRDSRVPVKTLPAMQEMQV